jgi:hypothetical protein
VECMKYAKWSKVFDAASEMKNSMVIGATI